MHWLFVLVCLCWNSFAQDDLENASMSSIQGLRSLVIDLMKSRQADALELALLRSRVAALEAHVSAPSASPARCQQGDSLVGSSEYSTTETQHDGQGDVGLPPLRASYETCIVGAGPAGLQMGMHLQHAQRDYVIFERNGVPGSFFAKLPRHRRLISVNRRSTGRAHPDYNLRHDWHSLLSDGEPFLFGPYSKEFYPDADSFVKYLAHYQRAMNVSVRFDTTVEKVRAPMKLGGSFAVSLDGGGEVACQRMVMAQGLTKAVVPEIIGIELAEMYKTVNLHSSAYFNKSVAILGGGNSAHEVARGLLDSTAFIHIRTRSPPRLAWETHYIGDLRALNTHLLDTYQLKTQDAFIVENAAISPNNTVFTKVGDKVCIDHPNRERFHEMLRTRSAPDSLLQASEHSLSFYDRVASATRDCYDVVINCLGFKYDDELIHPKVHTTHGDKLPSILPSYESSIPSLYFIGSLGHAPDYRKSAGGFLHGFRYTVRSVFRAMESQYHAVPYPHSHVRPNVPALVERLLYRMDTSSALYQMFGSLCDLVILNPDNASYFEEVTPAYVPSLLNGNPFVVMTLEYGQNFVGHQRVFYGRPKHRLDPKLGHVSAFLHPVVRVFRFSEELPYATHHVLEDIYTNFTCPILRGNPLQEFLAESVAALPWPHE